MAKKRIYRSLFDADEIYEVEELTDNPEVSTEGIAKVKQDETEISNKQLWDLLCEVKDLLNGKPIGDNEPEAENKVKPVNPEIDNEEVVTTNDEEEIKKVEEENERSVKDSYSKFAKDTGAKVDKGITPVKVAFQKRYDAVANK